MINLKIKSSAYQPYIFFDGDNHHLEINGKSYPENAAEFYYPVFKWLKNYLSSLGDQTVTLTLKLSYFNSSSSKALANILDVLDNAAGQGKKILVNWYYDEDDETLLEYGEDFKAESKSLRFTLIQNHG